jgi:SnoaL-like domain
MPSGSPLTRTLGRTKPTLLSLMPSSETLESFLHLVEAGETVEAMHRFYAEHASMQENAAPPRVGKAALIKHEEAALTSISSMKATCVRPIFVSGDFVVIRWVFEIQDKKGQTMRFEELAYQRWEGNFMAEEKFFYDPAQFK